MFPICSAVLIHQGKQNIQKMRNDNSSRSRSRRDLEEQEEEEDDSDFLIEVVMERAQRPAAVAIGVTVEGVDDDDKVNARQQWLLDQKLMDPKNKVKSGEANAKGCPMEVEALNAAASEGEDGQPPEKVLNSRTIQVGAFRVSPRRTSSDGTEEVLEEDEDDEEVDEGMGVEDIPHALSARSSHGSSFGLTIVVHEAHAVNMEED